MRAQLSARLLVLRPPSRILQPQAEQRERQPRRPATKNAARQPNLWSISPPSDVSRRRADRDRREEDREDPSPFLLRKGVSEKGGRDRSVGRLADADRGPRREEAREGARESTERRREAPDPDAEREKPRPPPAVAERPEDRRRQHVDENEAGHERPELRVGELELRLLQAFDERGDDVAVEVVEEIDERQDRERDVRGRPASLRPSDGRRRANGRPGDRRRRSSRGSTCGTGSRAFRRSPSR